MGSKKINQIALSIIILSIILVLIFIDKILINLTAAFMVVGIPTYYYFINNSQLCYALLIFFIYLFYFNQLSNDNNKRLDDEFNEDYPRFLAENRVEELNTRYQEDKSYWAKRSLHSFFLLISLTVPASFLLSIIFGFKKFSLAVLSTDFFLRAGYVFVSQL